MQFVHDQIEKNIYSDQHSFVKSMRTRIDFEQRSIDDCLGNMMNLFWKKVKHFLYQRNEWSDKILHFLLYDEQRSTINDFCKIFILMMLTLNAQNSIELILVVPKIINVFLININNCED